MFRIPIPLLSIMACLALLGSADAQMPLAAADALRITAVFDSSPSNSLKCAAEPWKPALDFALRFVSGYIVYCRLGQFEGKPTTMLTYLRVTPAGKPSAVFGSAYRVPELAQQMRSLAGNLNKRKRKDEIGMSGAFSVGTGDYLVEVLVIDDEKRTWHKRWKVRAATSHSQRDVSLAIQPLSLETLDRRAWPIAPPQPRGGLRLTILVDAAPINPYQPRLRAWDRAFLLQSLYSLLRQTPYKSVRLVAFNLDQQREIFRQDNFDAAAFLTLSQTLRDIETATVSVQALKTSRSAQFLATLANQELAADSADAIIFLGPNARLDAKLTADALAAKKPTSPPFFYFEYFAWRVAEFPDSIQSLMNAVDGKTFHVHSPAEFDQDIQKMLSQLKQE